MEDSVSTRLLDRRLAARDLALIPVVNRKIKRQGNAHAIDSEVLIGVIGAPGPILHLVAESERHRIVRQRHSAVRGLQIRPVRERLLLQVFQQDHVLLVRQRSDHIVVIGDRLISELLPEIGLGLNQAQLGSRHILLKLELLQRQLEVISLRQIACREART